MEVMKRAQLLLDLFPLTNGVLSELRLNYPIRSKALKYLLTLPKHSYELEQWNYCLSYLFYRQCQFKSIKHCKKYIKLFLKDSFGCPF